jgi:C-terminal processing protease CtpA/Prc
MVTTRLSAFVLLLVLLAWSGALRADDFGTPGQSTHRMAGVGVALRNQTRAHPQGDTGQSSIAHLVVTGIIPGSPAEKIGLRVGDEIISVDDEKVAGLKFSYAVDTLIRGELDSVVKITLRRAGASGLMTFVMNRTIVPTEQKRRVQP